MKKKLRLIALLLVLSLLTFTACGPISGIFGGEEENPGENPGGEPGDELGDEPGDQPGDQPGDEPGDQPDDEPGDEPGNEPGDEPGNEPGDEPGDEPGNEDEKPEDPVVLNPINIYLVGDSTVCSFNDDYYYPRYGYGTQLSNYLDEKATVVNLALSGRSSKSFITEENYQTLKNSIKAGDYLIIGFGHNDEKSDDTARFTDASKAYTEEGSFGYYLNEYYVKLAVEAGAIPVLCTPVVRAKTNDDYSGNEGHVTATGDYAQAIRDLGKAVGVSVIDLTEITKAEYISKGYDGAKLYHAVVAGEYDTDGTTVIPSWTTVDKTHLNIYGAKFVAYNLANALKNIEGIGSYVLSDIAAPTEADLVPKEGYTVPDYLAPDLDNYVPNDCFATTSEGWYGTAFGDTGGNPVDKGFFAKEVSDGVFSVGNEASNGKFSSSADGIAFAFRQIAADQNFKISVSATVKANAATKQAGFGLMLRDDCYINAKTKFTANSNYVTAGLYCDDATSCNALFYRENASLKKGDRFGAMYAVDQVYTFSIERVGQAVTVTVILGDQTVSKVHTDFDFFAKDTEFMYVGMFANRGTVVEFSNVQFEITGTSQGA